MPPVCFCVQEEMQRGYFDDFRDFRDSKGKVFAAPERLVPAASVRCCLSSGRLRLVAAPAAPAASLAPPGSCS